MAKVNIQISLEWDEHSKIEDYCKDKGLAKSRFLTDCALEHINNEVMTNG